VRRPGERLFAVLLHCYPREFRREYEAELMAFFRQDRDHPKYGSGPIRAARFWSATLGDLVGSAWRQRCAARKPRQSHASSSTAPAGRAGRALRSDLRYASRALWSAPGVTIPALAVLTLGIGTSTAIFSVVDAVALRGLPFADAGRLVSVAETDLGRAGSPVTVARPNYIEWLARQDVFGEMAASAHAGRAATVSPPIEHLRIVRMTASLFDVLRVAPALGRRLVAADERRGATPVAIISDGLWRRRFQARPDAIGRIVAFEGGASYEIVGVMPAGFTWPIGSVVVSSVDLWVPLVATPRDTLRTGGRTYNLTVVARLRPDVTIAMAAARMTQIRDALATEYPDWFVDHGVAVRPLHSSIVGAEVRSWMMLLLAAVGFVLLIACLNVANLLLARAAARAREVAVRSALGASPWDLARALIVESLMLSLVGAISGVLLAFWGVRILRATLPEGLPRLATVAVDLRVLAVAALVASVTGLLFGTLPALQFSRPDVSRTLRLGGRSHTGGRLGTGLRTWLVTAEVALAVVLLAGAGLFISSFLRLLAIDLGLNPDRVVSVDIDVRPPGTGISRAARLAAAHPVILAALERAQAVSGVVAASVLSSGLPLSGTSMTLPVQLPGRRDPPFDNDDSAFVHGVSARYLDVMQSTLLRGRWIQDSDVAGSPPVVVLSDEAVRRYFAGHDPLGSTVLMNDKPVTVVGVVRGVRLGGPESSIQPEAYIPFTQSDQPSAEIVFRTGPDSLRVGVEVKAAIQALAPGAVVYDPETIDTYFARLIAQRKFNMIVLTLFGALAVTIASVGIYGLMAFLVAERTREIGVRIALGAVPGSILQMVLGRAARLMLVGLAGGLVGAAALERAIRVFLFDARAHDPVVYGGVALVLLATGLVAAFGPARRAARVDPLVALRAE